MAREHEGRFGKFYSEWAFDMRFKELASRNREVYDAFTEALDIHKVYRDNFEAKRPEGHGEETFIYREGAIGYAHSDFSVIDMPEWMTMAEAALVIDRGNLCFGFRTSGSTVTIHTD